VPVRLATKSLEKIWGSPHTEPWHRNSGDRKVGEIWFTASDLAPILVKILLTTANLSVQVHPGDEYARVHEGGSPGKTEMWHILRAEPGAKIAVGLREKETAARVRAAALNGRIMEMLHWIEVQPGDTFFIPSGTIHAIGAGLALCEVQQVSDVTYRLYDYGRDRGLHMDRGLDVASLEPCDAQVLPRKLPGDRELLAECGYFRTERLPVRGSAALEARARNYLCIALSGEGTLAGEPFRAGDGWEFAAGEGTCAVESPDATFLITQ
jgi:mannose-6-phosphate isomerase